MKGGLCVREPAKPTICTLVFNRGRNRCATAACAYCPASLKRMASEAASENRFLNCVSKQMKNVSADVCTIRASTSKKLSLLIIPNTPLQTCHFLTRQVGNFHNLVERYTEILQFFRCLKLYLHFAFLPAYLKTFLPVFLRCLV